MSAFDSNWACTVDMDASFAIAEGVCNGGYVLAVAHQVALAALTETGTSTLSVLAASAQYLAPTPAGSVQARVARRDLGRSISRVEIELTSNCGISVRAFLSFISPFDPAAEPWCRCQPPPIAPRAECVSLPDFRPDGSRWPAMYRDRIDLRLDPTTAGFLVGTPSGQGKMTAWWGLRDQRPVDGGRLLLALDAMPPATIELPGRTSRSPTVQLEAHLYRDAGTLASPSAPLVVHQKVVTAGSVVADQVCEVWDAKGRLLASATHVRGHLNLAFCGQRNSR